MCSMFVAYLLPLPTVGASSWMSMSAASEEFSLDILRAGWLCEGFIRHRPPGPRPRIRLALPPPLRAQILKKFKILKFSSELEIFIQGRHVERSVSVVARNHRCTKKERERCAKWMC